MSEDANPAPLPVVACDIALWSAEGVATVHPYQHGDIPALAVPLALFEDAGFRKAVGVRHRRMTYDAIENRHSSHASDQCFSPTMFDAIAAELRARAGVPETNFGNVGGGA
jgi:hypothetical protein